jgi:hypothetical protein
MGFARTELCVQHSTVMKEYVVVPDTLLADTEVLKAHYDTSFAYVDGLKPKPTTRKKKPAAKK